MRSSRSRSGFRCRPAWAAAAATRPRRWKRWRVLWRVKVTRDRLHRMAAAIGADVPFFSRAGPFSVSIGATGCFRCPTCRRRGSCSSFPVSASAPGRVRLVGRRRAGGRQRRAGRRRTAGRAGRRDGQRPAGGRRAAASGRSRSCVEALERHGAFHARCRAAARPFLACSTRSGRRAAATALTAGRTTLARPAPDCSSRRADARTLRSAARLAASQALVYTYGLRHVVRATPEGSSPIIRQSVRETRARHVMGRGQAVRRGTLDPVFEGSNPSAPANLREAAGRWVSR